MIRKEKTVDAHDGHPTIAIRANEPAKLKFLLSVEEAAGALSLSRTRLFALLKDEQIISVKVGGLRRIPVTALHEYVERLTSLRRVG